MRNGERKNLYQFASYVGVSHGTMSFWINGVKKPNEDNVERLAVLFIDIVYLSRVPSQTMDANQKDHVHNVVFLYSIYLMVSYKFDNVANPRKRLELQSASVKLSAAGA